MTPTREVYARVVEDVLPRMHKAQSARELKALLKTASIDQQADAIGLTKWIDAQPALITRKALLTRLWSEREFQALWRERAATGLNRQPWQRVPDVVLGPRPNVTPPTPDQPDSETEQ
jgi:hypothetical protein